MTPSTLNSDAVEHPARLDNVPARAGAGLRRARHKDCILDWVQYRETLVRSTETGPKVQFAQPLYPRGYKLRTPAGLLASPESYPLVIS